MKQTLPDKDKIKILSITAKGRELNKKFQFVHSKDMYFFIPMEESCKNVAR